jgi:transposase
VHPADIQDRDGGMLVLSILFGMYPFFADGGYLGPVFQKALAKALPHLEIEIVKRPDHAKGFEVLSRRWVVERAFAWLNRCRRLAKDFENLARFPDDSHLGADAGHAQISCVRHQATVSVMPRFRSYLGR